MLLEHVHTLLAARDGHDRLEGHLLILRRNDDLQRFHSDPHLRVLLRLLDHLVVLLCGVGGLEEVGEDGTALRKV